MTKIESMEVCAERLREVAIYNRDALKVIGRFDSPSTLHYCDPPYVSTDQKPYEHKHAREDLQALVDALEGCEGAWIVSGYAESFQGISKPASVEVHSIGKGKEIIWLRQAENDPNLGKEYDLVPWSPTHESGFLEGVPVEAPKPVWTLAPNTAPRAARPPNSEEIVKRAFKVSSLEGVSGSHIAARDFVECLEGMDSDEREDAKSVLIRLTHEREARVNERAPSRGWKDVREDIADLYLHGLPEMSSRAAGVLLGTSHVTARKCLKSLGDPP